MEFLIVGHLDDKCPETTDHQHNDCNCNCMFCGSLNHHWPSEAENLKLQDELNAANPLRMLEWVKKRTGYPHIMAWNGDINSDDLPMLTAADLKGDDDEEDG